MPMVRCSTKKHVYNSDVHDSCPYCTIMVDSPSSLNIDDMEKGINTEAIREPNASHASEFNDTVKIHNDSSLATQRIYTNDPTVRLDSDIDISKSNNPYQPDNKNIGSKKDNSESTIKSSNRSAHAMKTKVYGFQSSNKNSDEAVQNNSTLEQLPVTGWLVIVEGPGMGTDFRLIQGENRIGRDSSMEVCLDFNEMSDEMVSRDSHAIVVYDNNANIFFVERGRSRNLPLLNSKTIRMGEDVKSGDIIQVGNTKLMVVTFCNENFKW